MRVRPLPLLPFLILVACSATREGGEAGEEAAVADRAQTLESAATKGIDRAVNELEPVEVWSPVNVMAVAQSNAAPPPSQ